MQTPSIFVARSITSKPPILAKSWVSSIATINKMPLKKTWRFFIIKQPKMPKGIVASMFIACSPIYCFSASWFGVNKGMLTAGFMPRANHSSTENCVMFSKCKSPFMHSLKSKIHVVKTTQIKNNAQSCFLFEKYLFIKIFYHTLQKKQRW